ncbi:MAG: hypothetical protein IKQ32_05130 [Prevotella sp.]|nr:hypothetical protein [Prevotella sp.]
MKTKLLSMLMLCMGATAMATNYYAAPGANGSGTSISDPGDLASLASSKSFAGGDSLFLMDGVYYITTTVDVKQPTSAGTADKMTYVGAYKGAHPIVDGSKMSYGGQTNGVRTRVNYVHLYGITVRYAGFKGFLICGSYNKIENCTSQASVDSGFGVKDADNCTIINCDSFDSFDYEQGGSSKPDFGGNADGFCDKQFTGGGNTYINCRAWNNSDDGWDLYKRGTTSPIVFINCITYNNSPEYYDFTGNPRLEVDKAWFDTMEGKTATTTKGVTKTWYRNNYYNNGNKNGFKIGGAGVATDVTMYRCLAVANTIKGFDQNYTQGNVKLYNCSAYDNKNNYHFGSAEMQSLDIRNSISHYSHEADWSKPKDEWWKDIITTGNYTHSSNSWDMDGMTPTNDDFISLDPATSVGGRKDGTFTVPTMCLAEGSKFIDAGEIIDGYTDYKGSKPDLGWKEYDPDIPTEVISVSEEKTLPDMRRLNIYTLDGQLVGMSAYGNLRGLKAGAYIVRDFDSGKAVKVVVE